MRVKEVMNASVKTCHPETSVADATTMMWQVGCSSLPVVDWEDHLVGVVTDRDVAISLSRTGRAAPDVAVSEAMTHAVATYSPETDIHTGLDLMRKAKARRLPVVDSEGKLVGVFSLSRFLQNRKETDEVSTEELLEFAYGDF